MSTEANANRTWLLALLAILCVGGAAWSVIAMRSQTPAAPHVVELGPGPAVQPAPAPPPPSASGSPGKLPNLHPGLPCSDADDLFGQPSEQDEFSREWNKADFSFSIVTDAKCSITGISAWTEAPQSATTPDGVTLGRTTLGQAHAMLAHRVQAGSELVVDLEGNYEGVFTVGPSENKPWRTIYRALLNPKFENSLDRYPVYEDYANSPVTEYSVDMVKPTGPPPL